MALNNNSVTSYNGEKAAGYISAAILAPNTIENGGVEVKPNVKHKLVLKHGDVGSAEAIIKDATCGFETSGDVLLTERVLEPKELQVNLELCKSDYRNDWDAIEMGYSAHDKLPKSFEEFLIAEIGANVAAGTESSIWNGDGTNNGQFDGFLKLIENAADLPQAQELAAVGGGINSGNVIDEMAKVLDAMPDALYGKQDLKLYVSPKIYRLYVRVLGGFAAEGKGANGFEGKGPNQDIAAKLFDGVEVFMANGLSGDKMVLAQSSNLYFGTGLLSDHNEIKIIDMADIDGSQNVRFIMRYTAGVQIGTVSDIVSYGVTNTAND